MSSLQAIQLLTTVARIAREEHESFSKVEITKKLQDIKYLSSQKKVPRLSLRKDIIHLENQLQGVLGLEERFARQKDKESITVASLKQQLSMLKNKLRAVEDLDLDKKVDHLSFLLGEHLAKLEIAQEVSLTETMAVAAPLLEKEAEPLEKEVKAVIKRQPEVKREETLQAEEKAEDKHQAGLDMGKKAMMLQKRLEALKGELDLHRELGSKNPKEIKLIEETIKVFEEKLQTYYEQHPEAMLHEVGTVDVPANFEVKHKMLFQAELTEEVKDAEKRLPLPPPPRMGKRE